MALSRAALKISKSVITAAGRNQNKLPLQVLVDSDGAEKAAIRIILEEVLSAGVEEVAIVISPGDRDAYAQALRDSPAKIHFIEQQGAPGYGNALLCAREFVGGSPFLHLVSDHLYVSGASQRCAQQLVEAARSEGCAVSAVQPTREGLLLHYGAIGGKGVHGKQRLYQVDRVIEKPSPTLAEQELIVPGLRAGHYLCFFGMHVLTPGLLEILASHRQAHPDKPVGLSPALSELAAREKYLAYEVAGRRYNLGQRFGLLTTQLALGLAGRDREEILAQLVEVLATRPGAA